jgi:transcriptional regulator with XRE-family HTH domain
MRDMRVASGLTQSDVARRAGMDRSNMSRLEVRGTRDLAVVYRVAAAIGVEPSALLPS